MLSFAEENYLKAIYHLSQGGKADISTNRIADNLETRPASVSDMVKKLAQKGVVLHKKYQGVSLSDHGLTHALRVIRKHRLWEVFLLKELKFQWDEVHEVAEQLEHIKSPLLIKRLDRFLGFPRFDPHGDPIPNQEGQINSQPQLPLAGLKKNRTAQVAAVRDSSKLFLQYMDKIGAYIGAKVKVVDKIPYDDSMEISVDNAECIFVSKQVSQNILVSE